MLTEIETKIVADVRANAAVTGEQDARTPSDLRREQRRLLAIIDRLTAAAPLLGTPQKDLAFALFASQFDIEDPNMLAACRSDYYAAAFDSIRPDFEKHAEKVLLALALRPALPAPADAETIQILLDLLNPLHGELDRQTYDDRVRENSDTPDREYSVNVTARMERDLTQAVYILEDRKRQAAALPAPAPEIIFWYRNHRGEEGYRRVRPISLRYGTSDYYKERQWLLLAFDLEKNAEREFALANAGQTVGKSLMQFGAALPAPAGWQEIETAPKDGTEVLLWWPEHKLDDDGNLTDEVVGGTRVIGNFAGSWQEFGGLDGHGHWFGDDSEPGHEPTYWMPLPAAPAPAEPKEG